MTGGIVWMTGMPSAGKTTLARAVASVVAAGCPVEVLDGDEMRAQLSPELGFSRVERNTNVSRIGLIARLLAKHGVLVIVALVSPYQSARDEVRELSTRQGLSFVEVFVTASVDALIARDVKGLYKRALSGELLNLTGISDPYEAPLTPDLTVRTDVTDVAECVDQIVEGLIRRNVIPASVRRRP